MDPNTNPKPQDNPQGTAPAASPLSEPPASQTPPAGPAATPPAGNSPAAPEAPTPGPSPLPPASHAPASRKNMMIIVGAVIAVLVLATIVVAL